MFEKKEKNQDDEGEICSRIKWTKFVLQRKGERSVAFSLFLERVKVVQWCLSEKSRNKL